MFKAKKDNNLMEKITSLCKRRGYIFQSSEIYGGFGAYDYGPLGIELKNNIKKAWWKMFVTSRSDMVGQDASILMNPKYHVHCLAQPEWKLFFLF